LDEIWLKYSKYSRIEFACFSFRVGLLFYQLFQSFCLSNRTPKITRILTLYQANTPALTSAFFIKHTRKLIIFGTHNLQTFKHNILINKVLLMQFYLFNIRPKLHHWKLRKLCINCSEHSQLHQQPVDAVVRPTFIWKFSYKLPGALQLTIIQTFDQNFVFFTEWCHVDRHCEV